MMEELMERRLDPKKRQKKFAMAFNSFVISGLQNCIVKEKLSSVKDKYFRKKLAFTLYNPAFQMGVSSFFNDITKTSFERAIITAAFATVFVNVMTNFSYNAFRRRAKRFDDEIERIYGQKLNLNKNSLDRKLDHAWEYVLPPIEIDKVFESFAYLNTFGHKLVREK